MPFVLIVAGSLLFIAAVRGTQQDLFYLLARDFTGPHNFIFWIVAILIIGAVGYIPRLKPVSDGFLILVILALFIRKGTGFFDMFQQQIGTTTTAKPVVSAPAGGSSLVNLGGGPSVGVTLPGGVGIGVNV
jgi:hypothetical protein